MLTVAYGMGAFGMLGVSPLAPSLVDGFGLSRLDVAFIVPSVYLGGLLFSLPAGRPGATFAGLSMAVAAAMALLGGAIHRECVRARDQA